MRRGLSVILLMSGFHLIGQKSIDQTKLIKGDSLLKEVEIVFNSGTTKLKKKHKEQLDGLKELLFNNKEVWIYPLATYKKEKGTSLTTYSSMFNTPKGVWFDKKSISQAQSILKYLDKKGYPVIGIEKDFISKRKGPTIRIKLQGYKDYIPKGNFATKIIAEENIKKKKLTPIPLQTYYPDKSSQYFIIDPLKDTLLIGEEGTRLFFARGTMLSRDSVQIELKEFYKMEDFMKADLSTVSNGKMIQTGGTIYLDARKKADLSKQVQINPSRGVNVEFTNGNKDPEMEVFLKDKKATETNWLRAKKSSWGLSRKYWNGKDELVKQLDFDSPDKYQFFKSSGEEKELEDQLMKAEIERAIKKAIKKLETARKEFMEIRLAEEREARIKDSIEYVEYQKQRKKQRASDQVIVSRLQVNNLGFINCDKFYDEATKEFNILANQSIDAYYYLIFDEVDGVLKGDGEKNIDFGAVPINKSATIIAVCITKKEKYFFKKKISSLTDKIGKIKLFETSQSQIDRELSFLN